MRTAYEIFATIVTMAFCAFVAVVYVCPQVAAWLRP
jgi:hypothetical protein